MVASSYRSSTSLAPLPADSLGRRGPTTGIEASRDRITDKSPLPRPHLKKPLEDARDGTEEGARDATEEGARDGAQDVTEEGAIDGARDATEEGTRDGARDATGEGA